MSLDPFEDPELERLIHGALELQDQGIQPELEALCHARPDLLDALETALQVSQRLPHLQQVSGTLDPMLGSVLNQRYRLETRLGSGAMGVVYQAVDMELSRTVAVKILNLSFGDELDAESRFSREAKVLGAIQHPAVVTIHDRGRTPTDAPFLVMESIEGHSLNHLMARGDERTEKITAMGSSWVAEALGVASLDEPSYLRLVISWAAELAAGLEAAHEKGIFHRDVKPSNIMVRPSGKPVLLDFGIASFASQETLTQEGKLLGTPAYMAPEALDSRHKANEGLDIYGLSATLYHMLTRRPPYRGTPSQILTALTTRAPAPVARIQSGLPQDLIAILDRGMARHPSDRYATIHELEADLRAFLEYRPVKARPLSHTRRLWRLLQRSRAAQVTLAASILAIAIPVGLEANELWKSHERRQFLEAWQHIPAELGIASPTHRVLSVDEGRERVAELLDQSVEHSPTPFPAQLYRAVFRWDHGNHHGSARDMRRIANWIASPFAEALAEHFRASAEDPENASLDVTKLPAPKEDMDLYVAAFFAIRDRRLAEAKKLLEDPLLAQFLPAQELLIVLMTNRPQQLERVVWLEEKRGCRTANSANLMGVPLILRQDYQEASRVFEEGLVLAPTSHTLLVNAARAAWRSGQPGLARTHYEKAIALRPDNEKAHEQLIRLLITEESLTQAQEILDSSPFGETGPLIYRRPYLQGCIEAQRAASLWAQNDRDGAVESAERAQALFDGIRATGVPVSSSYSMVSSALLSNDTAPLYEALVAAVSEQPLNFRRLELLGRLMPDELDEQQVEQLRSVLEGLGQAIVGQGLYSPLR